MKALPPLMILCYGVNAAWYAKVLKVGSSSGKWRRPDPKDEREAKGKSAREAVRHAITLYGKEPRTCRRCGTTWECKRTRAIRICPRCQQGRAEADMVPLIVNREAE